MMCHGPRCELLTVFGFQLIDYFYRGSYWLVWHPNSPPLTHTHNAKDEQSLRSIIWWGTLVSHIIFIFILTAPLD